LGSPLSYRYARDRAPKVINSLPADAVIHVQILLCAILGRPVGLKTGSAIVRIAYKTNPTLAFFFDEATIAKSRDLAFLKGSGMTQRAVLLVSFNLYQTLNTEDSCTT
jgi:hypothetical protein